MWRFIKLCILYFVIFTIIILVVGPITGYTSFDYWNGGILGAIFLAIVAAIIT